MSSTPPNSGDWVTTVVGYLDRGVALVRDRTTAPAVKVARLLVWGLLAAILGLVAGILGIIALDRVIVILTGHRAYLAHLIVGIVLMLGGLLLMRKRHVSEES